MATGNEGDNFDPPVSTISSPPISVSIEECNRQLFVDSVGERYWELNQHLVLDGNIHDFADIAGAAGHSSDEPPLKMRCAERSYEDQILKMTESWLRQQNHRVTVNGTPFTLQVGQQKTPGPVFVNNCRKCRTTGDRPDLLLYISSGARNYALGVIEMKSGNGSDVPLNKDSRSAIQQAVCYGISFQRPLMCKTDGGMKRWRLPLLVLCEDRAYWLSLTTEDALVYPYTLAIRQYRFGNVPRDDAAMRLMAAYVRSLLLLGERYPLDNGFEADTSQVLLARANLAFPAVADTRIRRSLFGNNLFQCDSSALTSDYFRLHAFRNKLLDSDSSLPPKRLVVKVVSPTFYNTQCSAVNLVQFLNSIAERLNIERRDQEIERLRQQLAQAQVQQADPQSEQTAGGGTGSCVLGTATSDKDARAPSTSGSGAAFSLPQLQPSTSEAGRLTRSVAAALQSVYDAHLWIGARGSRTYDPLSGILVVTEYRGDWILSAPCQDVLAEMFTASEVGAVLRQHFEDQVLVPAFAAVALHFCHFDIRPPNVTVLRPASGADLRNVQFSIIDWDEVIWYYNFMGRWQLCSGDDGWYPDVREVRELADRANLFTACQLFLCVFAMRRALHESTHVELSIRRVKDLWKDMHGDKITDLIAQGTPGRKKFIEESKRCFVFLQENLYRADQPDSNTIPESNTIPDSNTICRRLREYLDLCAMPPRAMVSQNVNSTKRQRTYKSTSQKKHLRK